MTQHLIIPEILVFSKRTWDTLSKEDQDLIMKEAKEAQPEQWKLGPRCEKKSIDDMKANGVEIIEVDNKAMAGCRQEGRSTRSTPRRCMPFIERIQAVK